MYTLQKDKDLNLKYQIATLAGTEEQLHILFYFQCCYIIILFLHSIMYTRS